MRALFAILALGIVAVNGPPRAFAEPYAPRVGERHPDFVLPAIGDRRPVGLSQFRGKKVLLVHFASW
jgi:hypothetical protein